eukprot:Rhum_TRINITY_DN18496_c0_g1::Rhum_TRINITY_DN18496_c0_g1_i1::g.167438::m.167438
MTKATLPAPRQPQKEKKKKKLLFLLRLRILLLLRLLLTFFFFFFFIGQGYSFCLLVVGDRLVEQASLLTALRLRLLLLVILQVLPVAVGVQDVVLNHEDDVEEHRARAQTELDRVTGHLRPVALRDAVHDHLRDRQGAAGEVEKDVPDVPTGRSLAAVVQVDLRGVLHDGDAELHPRKAKEEVQPRPRSLVVLVVTALVREVDEPRREHDEEEHNRRQRHRVEALVTALVEEDLREGDGRQKLGVEGEDDVVDANGDVLVVAVLVVVVDVDLVHPVVRHVVRRVAREAHQVQQLEVEAHAHNALAHPVQVHLRVERDRPRREVRPADDAGDALPGLGVAAVAREGKAEDEARGQDDGDAGGNRVVLLDADVAELHHAVRRGHSDAILSKAPRARLGLHGLRQRLPAVVTLGVVRHRCGCGVGNPTFDNERLPFLVVNEVQIL